MGALQRLRLPAAVLALGTALSACAGGAAAPAAGDRTPDPAAELTVAQFGGPTTFDPHKLRSPLSDPAYLTPVYDQLLQLDGELAVQPMLASSWEMSPDGTVMTLTLRPDVRFADGSGFDSSVVKANLERAKSLPDSTAAPLLSTLSAVETPDPTTVRIRFSAPNQTFPYTLASNFNVGSMISGRAIAAGTDLTRTPAGSGPYGLTEFLQDRAVYTRSDTYWDTAHPGGARTVTVIGMPDDNARLAALQSGQIQVAAMRPNSTPAYRDLIDGGTVIKQDFTGAEAQGLYLNTRNPALADPRVRTALSMAIDRTALNDALFAGAAVPAFQLYPEGMPGRTTAAEADPYDPDAAKRLLAEAGHPDLRLSVILTSTEPSDSIALVMQAQLAQVGVTLDLQKYAPTDSRPSWRKGVADGFGSSFQIGGDPTVFLRTAVLGPDDPGGAPADLAAAATAALDVPLTAPDRAEAFERITALTEEAPLHVLAVRVPLQYLASPDVLGLDRMTFSQIGASVDVRPLAVAGGGA